MNIKHVLGYTCEYILQIQEVKKYYSLCASLYIPHQIILKFLLSMISVLKVQKLELNFEDCRNIPYEDIAKNQLNKGKLKIDQDNIPIKTLTM